MIPVIVVVYYLPVAWSYTVAATIFFIAGLTDMLDGYLARRLNQSTALGAFLDPVADKLMVAISLTLLIHEYSSVWITIPAMIIIGREIVISALREWMAELGKRTSIAVSYVGKIKTAAQMGSIFFLLAVPAPVDNFIGQAGFVFLYIAAILTVWSMWQYLAAAWPDLTAANENEG